MSDTAAGILAAGESEAAVGDTFNLGSGRSIDIAALAQEVAHVVGRGVEIQHDAPRPGDVHDLRADASKAARVLGTAPTVTLADGLKRLKQWYDEAGVAPDVLLERDVVRNWESSGASSGR